MRCSASLSIVVFPLLLLYAARPEFRSSSPPRAVERDLRMTRLSACNVRTMVEETRVASLCRADDHGGIPRPSRKHSRKFLRVIHHADPSQHARRELISDAASRPGHR
jgi:hypothetical protein